MSPLSSTSDRRLPMRHAMRRGTRHPMASVLAVAALLGWLAGSGLPTATLAQDKPSLLGDPLPSWNDTWQNEVRHTKKAIIDFVTKVTTEGGSDFVPEAERIAVFDNDGTLSTEKPMVFEAAFLQYSLKAKAPPCPEWKELVLERVKAMAPQHPEWKEQQPFKAMLEGDIQTFLAQAGGNNVEAAGAALMAAIHAGMTTDEFEAAVVKWMKNDTHLPDGQFKEPVLYTHLVFQPMLDVLKYLWANKFKTYIVTGSGIDFMRPWARYCYGIPPEHIVGSIGKTKFELRDGKPVLVKIADVVFTDNKAGKPVGIHSVIGLRPIMSFGNSDGDIQMLQWTTLDGDGSRNKRHGFGLIVHHTDERREYQYDEGAENALKDAPNYGWSVADMKKDWKVIYPPLQK